MQTHASLQKQIIKHRIAKTSNAPQETVVPDPVTFIQDAIGMTLDPWQREVIESTEKRVLMPCARQVGKSQTAANLCAYRAVAEPGINILLISPSLRQSRLLFDKVESVLMKSVNPKVTFDIHTRTHLQLSNGSSIHALPGTNADLVRGHTSQFVIIEESCFISPTVFEVIFPMLGTTNGTIVQLSTPNGPQGVFWNSWVNEEDWHKVKVFAEDCPRISAEFLEEAFAKLGDYRARQEYGLEFLSIDRIFEQGETIVNEEALNPLDAIPKDKYPTIHISI